jgi:signal peptidase I
MADHGGPAYGREPGSQEWQGGGRAPRQRSYDYGVPSDDEYADDDSNHGGGGRGYAEGDGAGYQDQHNGYDAHGYEISVFGADDYGTNGYGANGYGANGYGANGYGPGGHRNNESGFNGPETNASETNASETNASETNGSAANGFGSNAYGRNGSNGTGGSGQDQSGYSGDYDYSEPFEYFGNSAGQQGPQRQEGPVQWAAQQPPPHETSDTIWLGVLRRPAAETDASWFPEPADAPGRGKAGPGGEGGEPTARRQGGRAERRRAAKRIKRRRRLSATREVPILIGVALLIALVLKTFLVQAFVIPSGSMEETIRVGDRVLVDKLTPWFGSKPERGDVVVFRDPSCWLCQEKAKPKKEPFPIQQGKDLLTDVGLLPSSDEQDLIKRVIAVGGDHVACCDRRGRVTVNGTPLHEPYLYPGNKPSEMSFDVHVPINRIFVMGDHRALSADSRYHLREPDNGTVSEDSVVGRAVVIAWPFGHWRRLEEPPTFTSVHNAPGAAAAGGDSGTNRVAQLPSPAELPLVIGLVGLSRLSGRRLSSVRSNRGGLGGRRSFRFWRRRGRWRRWPERRAP